MVCFPALRVSEIAQYTYIFFICAILIYYYWIHLEKIQSKLFWPNFDLKLDHGVEAYFALTFKNKYIFENVFIS